MCTETRTNMFDSIAQMLVPPAKFASQRSSERLCEKMAGILENGGDESEEKLAEAFVTVSQAIQDAIEQGVYRVFVVLASPDEAADIDFTTLIEYLAHNGYEAVNYPYGTIDVKW